MNQDDYKLGTLAEKLALGEAQHEVLRSKNCIVARVSLQNEESVIIKLWKRPGLRGFLRRITLSGNLDREWKTLNHLSRLKHLNYFDFAVPKALAKYRFEVPINGYTDALVLEDLGNKVVTGTQYLNQMLKQGSSKKRTEFESKVIELTDAIIKARVIDTDHHLLNILVSPSEEIIRIDFEVSRILPIPGLHKDRLASMLSGLLISYVIASHSYGKDYANEFAIQLSNRLKIPSRVLQHAKKLTRKNLDKHQAQTGLDLSWSPPW